MPRWVRYQIVTAAIKHSSLRARVYIFHTNALVISISRDFCLWTRPCYINLFNKKKNSKSQKFATNFNKFSLIFKETFFSLKTKVLLIKSSNPFPSLSLNFNFHQIDYLRLRWLCYYQYIWSSADFCRVFLVYIFWFWRLLTIICI